MTVRTLVTVHLPLEMGAVGRIMRAVAREWPDAVVLGKGGSFELQADDDPKLSVGARRRISRDRMRAAIDAATPSPGFLEGVGNDPPSQPVRGGE